MGGEIGIVDKENGERGTCFRFNIFLTTCNAPPSTDLTLGEVDIQAGNAATSGAFSCQLPQGLWIRTTRHPGLNVANSPRPSPRPEGSHVIILMESKERRRMVQKLFETLGIKVSVVREDEQFSYALKKIKRKAGLSHRSSSGASDPSPRSFRSGSSSNAGSKDMPLSGMDGTDWTPRKTSSRSTSKFVLILVEATAEPFPELCKAVAEFRRDLQNTYCRVVWLDKPTHRGTVDFRGLPEEIFKPSDLVLWKPFHGSRLYQVAKLLPEFGGQVVGVSPVSQAGKEGSDPILSSPPTTSRTTARKSPPSLAPAVRESEIQEVGGSSSHNQKPLMGKMVLVAEDNPMLSRLATRHVELLGGTCKTCDNGAEAVELVCTGLRCNMMIKTSMILPYDLILMDCEVQFTSAISISYGLI